MIHDSVNSDYFSGTISEKPGTPPPKQVSIQYKRQEKMALLSSPIYFLFIRSSQTETLASNSLKNMNLHRIIIVINFY